MLRKTAVALAISLVMPSAVWAVGLGTLKASSALNQPFAGKIEILGATAADFESLNVKLADAAQFERAGVARSTVLLKLKFEIIVNAGGVDYVRVSSSEAVREPYLDFLLELTWAQGRMVREYTALLDPPLYDTKRAQLRSAPIAAPAKPAVGQARARPVAAVTGEGAATASVQSHDTLWALAMRYRPDSSISAQQMMLGLLRANPDGFPTGNVNVLRQGAVLRIPNAAELNAISRAEAAAEIQRQTRAWQDYRQVAAARPVPQAATPAALPAPDDLLSEPATAPQAAAPKDARLEVVTPAIAGKPATPPRVGNVPSSPADGTSDMLAQEMATTQTNESDELKAKLTEAEGIIDLLQRQVQIKDEELARLQVNLGGGGDLATKPSDAPAASATPAPNASATPAPAASATPEPDASAAPTPTASATPEPEANAIPAPEASATPEPEASAAPEPEASATPAPTATPTPEVTTAVPVAVAPDSETALDALVPASLRNLVPGGALTIIGILGSLLALGVAALMRALSGRRVLGDRPAAGIAKTPVVEQAPAVGHLDEFNESLLETSPGDASFDPFSRTLEASSEQLLADTSLDPLEEVNVYLAYERFDQAEALVREVIQQHPNEPKYKLRLLEIYYSANQPEAYENAAKDLHLAVGENSALWESAVAMWNEMSPTHALLAPHAAPAAGDGAGQVGTSVEFVDLTALSETPQHVPSNADTDLDFDLSDLSADSVLGDVLDSTSDQTDERHFLDLTATVEKLEQAGFLPEPPPANEPEHDMFDVSGDSIASAPSEPSLEFTTDNISLLDLSATGDLFEEHTSRPRAGSVAGLSATASGDGFGGENTGHDFLSLEFDTGEPSLRLEDSLAVTDGGLDFDLDALAGHEGETLDFDLGGLEPIPLTEATVSAHTTLDIAGAPEDEFSFDLELDDGSSYNFDDLAPALAAEAAAEQDLLLKNPLFDLHTTANQGGDADEAELEFDLALQDTSDFSGILVDETLEMPASAAARFGQTPAESLEDLTRSMEASLEGFDFEQDDATDGDEFALDLSAAAEALGDDALDLDFDLDLAASDDTGKLSTEPDMALERTGMHFDRSSLLPTSADDNLLHSAAEEAENKLNLAKAYIELGEHAAARTMLEEVEKEGSSSQQEAARRLLGQIR